MDVEKFQERWYRIKLWHLVILTSEGVVATNRGCFVNVGKNYSKIFVMWNKRSLIRRECNPFTCYLVALGLLLYCRFPNYMIRSSTVRYITGHFYSRYSTREATLPSKEMCAGRQTLIGNFMSFMAEPKLCLTSSPHRSTELRLGRSKSSHRTEILIFHCVQRRDRYIDIFTSVESNSRRVGGCKKWRRIEFVSILHERKSHTHACQSGVVVWLTHRQSSNSWTGLLCALISPINLRKCRVLIQFAVTLNVSPPAFPEYIVDGAPQIWALWKKWRARKFR